MAGGFGKAADNTNSRQDLFAPNSFGNICNSNHNPFAPNAFGSTSNFGHNSVAPNSTGNTSNSNNNPFAPNAFGITSNFHHNPFAPIAFGNTSNSNHNPFAPNSFGNTSNSKHNPLAPNAFGNTSNINHNPFAPNAFGNTSNSNHNQFAPISIGNTCNSNHDPYANAFGTTTSTYGGYSTGVSGALPASSSKFTFGQPASFLGSSSTFEIISTESHGPFGSATSRGPFGSSTARGTFRGPSSSGFGNASARASGSSAVVGLISNKGNNAVAFKPLKSVAASQTTWSNLVQTNSYVLGKMPVYPFTSSSSAASPSLPAGLMQPLGGQNTGSRINSYKYTFLKGSECKLMSISAMPFYENKSHEELRLEDYELKSGGQQNSVNNQAVGITKQQFEFPLPSVTSSLNILSPPCIVPPFSTNMDTKPTSSISCLSSPDPSPIFSVSYKKTPAGCGQVAASSSNNQPLQRLQLPSTESGCVQETASYPWPYNGNSMIHVTAPLLTALPISAGNNNGVSLDIGQTQPSVPQQNSIVGGVKESIIAVKDPFGSERTTFQPSIGLTACSFVRHGISSLPVANEPAKTRVSSVLTSRYHSLKPLAVNVRRYHPSSDVPKVPFFDRVEEIQNKSKAYSYIMPRENPRAVLAVSSGLAHVSTSKKEASPLNHVSAEVYEQDNPKEANDNAIGFNKQLIPKLERSDYYTEPEIEKLASNERLYPGYCCRVKDFVVGRVGYGWVKFYGKTDVRGLDLDSHIQFSNQGVIVYGEDSEKPPVGQGLNKAAEVTLLNIKCVNKKTGKRYISLKKVDNFIEKLKKLAEKQGAEFVSYDPVKGEWKVSVQHF